MVKIHPQTNNPTIPPRPPPPPQLGRKGYCCLLFQLCFFLSAVICITCGVVVIIFASIFSKRSEIDVYVQDALLTNFDLEQTPHNSSLLFYNLKLNITMRNPNKRVGVYYDKINILLYYRENLLAGVSSTPFYQGHKSSHSLQATFEGQSSLPSASDEDISQFEFDKRNGVYRIVVKLDLIVRTKSGKIKYKHIPPLIECSIWVPLSSNGTSSIVFNYCSNVHIISFQDD
ncbi:hypothetical protein UlMin_005550 [Ulmus minor]